MIDLEAELAQIDVLSTQDRYDIISFAMEAADDNGFINSFVFERAVFLYAAILLYPERKDELATLIAGDIIAAWDSLLKDGTIQKMSEEYAPVLDDLANAADTWYDEYADWAHSARGILDVVQAFSSDIVASAANRLQTTASQTGVTELLETAEEWGMTRGTLVEREEKVEEAEEESLFQEDE